MSLRKPQNARGSLNTVFSRRLFFSTTLAMIIVAMLSLGVTVVQFNAGLRPYLLEKARAVSISVQQDIQYAMEIGIPFDQIRGLDEVMNGLINAHSEISGIQVVSATGQSLVGSSLVGQDQSPPRTDGDIEFARDIIGSVNEVARIILGTNGTNEAVSVDVVHDGAVVARVITNVNSQYLNDKMTSVFFDTLVILIAVALVALEVVVVVSTSQLTGPFRLAESALSYRAAGDLRQYQTGQGAGRLARFIQMLNAQNAALRDRLNAALQSVKDAGQTAKLHALAQRTGLLRADPKHSASIMDARIPLFVFCFAEELQKSFLPLFVAQYYSPTDLFARDIMMGLPISAFMFVIAVFTPFAGKLVDKFGNKTLFMAGLIPAIAGYVICFLAQTGNDILIGRSVTAIGYAVITISCQSYIAAVVTAENRARGMAVFVGVLMTATMCGTAIGAILADWLGYKQVFLIASCFAALAGLLGWNMLSTDLPAPEPKKTPAGKSRNPFAALARNTQFVFIVLFCAIPAKIILTGFLYLFVPIYLASLDATQSEIGRVMMLYSLIIIPISPLASGFADRLGKNLWMVIGATIASGIVLLGLYQSASVAAVLAVVAALGVVHAFLKAPLIVAAMEAAEKSPDITRTGALSLLRTSERIGSVIGPVVVAALLVVLDFGQVAAVLGITVAVMGAVMAGLSFGTQAKAALGSIAALAVGLSAAFGVFAFAGAATAQDSAQKPVRVHIAAWRGCEEACSGFTRYFEDRNLPVQFTILDADSDTAKLADMRAQILADQPDLVVTWGTSVSLAILGTKADYGTGSAIGDIPAVFMIVADPVGSNLVGSYDSSGRSSVAGVRNRVPEEVQLRLMFEYYRPKKLGVLNHPKELNSALNTASLRAISKDLSFDLIEQLYTPDAQGNVDAAQIPAALAQLKAQGAEAIYVGSSSYNLENQVAFIKAATALKMPVFSAYTQMVREGGALMAVGSNYANVGRLAAVQAEQIVLNGAKAGDLPVKALNRYSVILNMKTAKELNIYPPVSLLGVAEVVQ
jgi:ABC-type uncharacterized transport system substrate-binding protein/predicted MFS family arabinose efflux permease